MRNTLLATVIILLAVSSSCVRMPENYTYILDRAAETNEELLKKTEEYPIEKKLEIYRMIIEEDNKLIKATSETIKNGGGK